MQEKQRFEENWKNAFEGAEMPPPDHVWANVELDLAGEESKMMRKRVVFYQRLAAALLVVSASLGIYVWNSREYPTQLTQFEKEQPKNTEQNATQSESKTKIEATETTRLSEAAKKSSNAGSDTRYDKSSKNSDGGNHPTTGSSQTQFVASNAVSINEAEEAVTDPLNAVAGDTTGILNSEQITLAAANTQRKVSLDSAKTVMTEEEALKLVDAYLNPPEQKKEERTKSQESLWIAMGAAAGSYNPNTGATSPGTANTFALADKNSYASTQIGTLGETSQHSLGSARSMGVSIGKKVSARWVLQSGLNYINQQIQYSSNVVAFTAANQTQLFTPEYTNGADASPERLANVTTTTPYTINSAIELISIPVQAGYLIIDRRIGWQVNSGFSSDIFVRNVLVDESGRTERFAQSAGSDSPYRSVNWSGLLNSEVSYRLGTNYRLSLVPGLRYTFNSVLKDGTSTPMVLDIGFRFKYLFN